ncbi:MAG: response regulator [Armatimonadetes bacterium]|nr:response regulator [Armatimonadota bacterium]MDE2207544.1 response regulator [Armatimonadota bacterium]
MHVDGHGEPPQHRKDSGRSGQASGELFRALLLEDSDDDAALVGYNLKRAGLNPALRRVNGERDFRAALEESWDVIISDYELPQYDGLQALELVQQLPEPPPFILYSGAVNTAIGKHFVARGAFAWVSKDKAAELPAVILSAVRRPRAVEEDGRTSGAWSLRIENGRG